MDTNDNEKRLEYLKRIVSAMPNKPGSYQFFDKDMKVIYVGKAKNLKNRVASYFHTEVDRFKTKILVSKIRDIRYTIVNTEEDALLLENNLIKKYSPKYNILLKDGKTYPSICVTKETLPRIFATRDIKKNGGVYFGPYSHISTMHTLLDVINKIYHIRGCKTWMTEKGIKDGKYSKCLKYDMNLCEAPCIRKQSIEQYNENIKDAVEILKGNTRKIEEKLHEKMCKLADALEFEKAEEIKEKLVVLKNYVSKSEVVSHTVDNIDVFSITKDENVAFLNYIHVKKGSINTAFTFEYKNASQEDIKDILEIGIVEMRDRFKSDAKEIILPFYTDTKFNGLKITVPEKGDKKRLLDLSMLNVKQYKKDRMLRIEKLNPGRQTEKLMKDIKELLQLEKSPKHIECFDNSNISGKDAVAGCVVFKNLRPCKKEYRKYNIKTVIGADDYASMKEVVRRRYSRLKDENREMPDVILTDGGKGQMKVVRDVVFDELGLNIPIVGLAKNEKHRTNEVLIGFPPQTVGIDVKSEAFLFFTRVQDEVHRFAITFHREKRSKSLTHSELDEIKGIGPKTKNILLGKLKTIERIRNTNIEELIKIIGKNKAFVIKNHFEKSQE